MKRYGLVLLALMSMALMLLTMPSVVGANDQGWLPPDWTPTPPARPSIDLMQLVQMLLAKGMISHQEYAHLIQPQASSPTQPPQAMGRTSNEVDRNPVLSSR